MRPKLLFLILIIANFNVNDLIADAGSSGRTRVAIYGKCTVKILTDFECDYVTYSINDGRVTFTAINDNTNMHFFGQVDHQNDLNHYVLDLSNVIVQDEARNEPSKVWPVVGSCEMLISDDGDVIHSIECNALIVATRRHLSLNLTEINRIEDY